MLAIIGNELNLLFLDGLVGCFIALVILRGAFTLFRDLRDLNQGKNVDFEKYKLGIWKFYGKLQFSMLDNWILHQMFNDEKTKEELSNKFEQTFRPIMIHQTGGEDFIIKFSFGKKDLEERLEFLKRNGFISNQSTGMSLTSKGIKKIQKAMKSYHRHEKIP